MSSSARIYLRGGLGNNLFQFAYGLQLKLEGHSVEYSRWMTGDNWYNRLKGNKVHLDDLRSLFLEHVQLTDSVSPVEVMRLFKIMAMDKFAYGRQAVPPPSHLTCACLHSRGRHMNKGVFDMLKEVYLDVSREYAERLHPVSSKSVVIHFRGTDYPISKRATPDYYTHCLRDLGNSDYPVLWVTDDYSALHRSGLIGTNHDVLASDDSTSAFVHMSQAKVLVSAHSTFSYWAGLLGMPDRMYLPKGLSQLKEHLDQMQVTCLLL